ncbi:MAG: chromosome segregation protein SMC [Candidatus Woesearchaeota archaeon]|nr:chromosome segregation protein SMC [Candidatus Woesearchaeota archaeon]
MTKINKLVMDGFKSFAKRTELVFGGDFNCVLGPNGSGKSNILDALCFVLGKSSAKALRSEKSANLIYNGGKLRKPGKSAEVSIYFDNSKKTFPTDDEEVKVSRIVKASGQSIYKINNEARTRQQIVELLGIAKINPDSYNVILQGDIVQFVEMQPEERRGLIEEIAGISVYEEKKLKAMNELQRVDERMKEAEIVLNERKSRLAELRKDRDHAIKHKDLNDKIKINKASLIYRRMESKKKEKEEFDSRVGKQQKLLEEKNRELEQIKKGMSEKKARIDEINKEIETKGDKDQADINKEIERLKVDIASSKNRVESLKTEITKIKQRKVQLKENSDDISMKIKKLEEEKEEIRRQIQNREKEISQIEKRMGEFRKKNKLDDVEGLEKDIDKVDKEAEEMQKQVQKLREEQQELLRQKDRIEFQTQAIDEKIAKVLSVEKENKTQIEELKSKRENFKKLTLDLNKRLSKDSEFAAQLENARNSFLKQQEDLSVLNTKNISIQERLGENSALRCILDQKDKIRGIYGTVSELGKVDSKYALALEITAGSKITSVVVEDDKVAAQCIKYLKENKLGFATFLPLNKVKGVDKKEEATAIASSDGVHGFALNLISYEPKFKNVFSYVFGNTLVVDSIDTARRIGIGKAKMVSLDGDLAEMSGAMQGGYRIKRKGSSGLGFAEKGLEKEIEDAEKKLMNYDALVKRLEKDRKENDDMITGLRQEKANLEGDIIKLEKLLNLQSGDTEASRKERKELESQVKETDKKIEGAVSKISECNKVLAQNRIKRQDMRSRISELRNPALLAELNAFEEKKGQLKEELVAKNGEIKNFDAQILNVFNPELENIAKIMKQHEKEEEDFRQESETLVQNITLMGTDLKEKEEKQRQFQSKFRGLFIEKSKVDEKIKKDEANIEESTNQQRSIEQRIGGINVESAKVRAEFSALDEEFKNYEGVEILRTKSEQDLRKDIGIAEGVLTKMGSVNMKALEIFDQVDKEYNDLSAKREKLMLEKEDVLIMMNEIELKKKDMFMKTYDVVNQNFQRTFSALSTKGEAFLELENPELPFAGGLLIKVRITGNKFLDIRSLSGGEKSMTALAFIFSIQEHEPASFYVFDEVDAALDKKNSEKLSELIRKYSERAQYIIISHNDGLISQANTIYGVSMNEHGQSNVISLKI